MLADPFAKNQNSCSARCSSVAWKKFGKRYGRGSPWPICLIRAQSRLRVPTYGGLLLMLHLHGLHRLPQGELCRRARLPWRMCDLHRLHRRHLGLRPCGLLYLHGVDRLPQPADGGSREARGGEREGVGSAVFASRQHQLKDEALKRLEREWSSVELLIVDEVSFIGRAFFAKMHVRMQQGWALEHAGTRAGRLSSAGADTTIVAGLHVCRVRGTCRSRLLHVPTGYGGRGTPCSASTAGRRRRMMEVSSVEVSSAFTFVSRTAFSCCCPQRHGA